MFEVGQKVWDVVRGEGVVVSVERHPDYPVIVTLGSGVTESYTADGKYISDHTNTSLYPYPVEIVKKVTKPSIDWSHVSEDFQYLAMDSGGLHHLFVEKPDPIAVEWTTHALYIYAGHFASFSAGTCHWRDSLVKRPD